MTFEAAPLIIAIDDDRFYLDELGYELQEQNVEYKTFLGPSAFEEEAKEADVSRAKLIIVDYDFRTCTAVDRDLVGYIRDTYPAFNGKIVLLSLLDDFLQDDELVRKRFDAVLNKRCELCWDSIQVFLT